jgi:hypothetical protein
MVLRVLRVLRVIKVLRAGRNGWTVKHTAAWILLIEPTWLFG